MPRAQLSPETQRRLDALFVGAARQTAADLLITRCGTNLPFCEGFDARGLERIRFAALKLSNGDLGELRRGVELAQIDWRVMPVHMCRLQVTWVIAPHSVPMRGLVCCDIAQPFTTMSEVRGAARRSCWRGIRRFTATLTSIKLSGTLAIEAYIRAERLIEGH